MKQTPSDYHVKQQLIGTAIFAVLIFICAWMWVYLERQQAAGRVCLHTARGHELEAVTIRGQTCLRLDGELLWETPPEWYVRTALLTDIDQKPNPELILLLWKKGSFGSGRPFWLAAEPDVSYGTHIFIYTVDKRGVRMMWGSSETPSEVVDISLPLANTEARGIMIREKLYPVWWPSYKGLRTPEQEQLWYWGGWGLCSGLRGEFP